jgi:myo-inositol-1(or 4)-monophosphatase
MTISSALTDLTQLVTACGDDAKAQRHDPGLTRKPDGSLVTRMDQAIEQRLVSYLRNTHPTHAILGEEGTRIGTGDLAQHEYVWVIDPIDGTSAYASTLTGWCVGVGLVHYGRPVAGIVYAPMSDDLFVATPDGGAYRNGTRIHATNSRNTELDPWMAGPSKCHRRYHISYKGRIRTTGATILSLCYVATGIATAALVGRCMVWDIAPAMALLRNAGAELWDLNAQVIDIAPLLDISRGTPAMLAAPIAQYDTFRNVITIG